MRWGGGGTPSIDEPDKAYPQPVQADVIIQDEEKTSLLDEFYVKCIKELAVDSEDENYRGNELPNGYTQIEYLESTGLEYIDTGINGTEKTKVEFKFQLSSVTDSFLFGARQSQTVKAFCYMIIGGVYFGVSFGNSGNVNTGKKADTNVHEYIQDGRHFIMDGSIVVNLTDVTFETPGALRIFTALNGSPSKMKVFRCKIYDDGNLVRDFIPCYSENYVAGLYDVADHSGQEGYESYNPFYTNKGSGKFNVPYSLQGSGTAEEPYQISSAMDLAFMSYKAKSSSSAWNSKYFELTDDIVLNDGFFEEDGTYHDGGDGKLYEWTPIVSGNNAFFNGNGHSIKGLYFNSTASTDIGLFNVTGISFYNLHMKNLYINAHRKVFGLCYSAKTIENCSVAGKIIGVNEVCGFALSASTILKSTNYANVTASSNTGVSTGMVLNVSIAENCKNYGNISGGSCVGGIVARYTYGNAAKLIRYCENHGNITGMGTNGAPTGGIIGGGVHGDSASTSIIQCINKGKITSTGGAGGILGATAESGTICVSGCKNFGKVSGNLTHSGEIVGGVGSSTYRGSVRCVIEECECDSFSNIAFVGGFYSSASYCNQIRKCRIIHRSSFACLARYEYANLEVTDCSIEVENDNKVPAIQFNNGTTIMKNVMLNSKTTKSKSFFNGYDFFDKCLIYGACIVQINNSPFCYYGSDFSALFVKWKTGYIGLKALESAGVYMFAIPDEEYLKQIGYEKKG